MMKGRTTISELQTISNRIFHTLYHQNYLMEEARKKREKQKQNQPTKNRNPLDDMVSSAYSGNMTDELEELVEEGMI